VLVLALIFAGTILVAALLAIEPALGAWVFLLGFIALMIGIGIAGELQPDPPE
jgi:hypothetical protein